jgi:hypothetical protein
MADLFLRSGSGYDGPVTRNERGRLGVVRERRCGRCGGAGRSAKWAHSGWTCYDCGGSGHREKEWVPLYTSEQLAKLAAATAKRAETAAAKRAAAQAAKDAEVAARRAAFETAHADLLARARAVRYSGASPILGDLLDRATEKAVLSDAQVAFLARLTDEAEAHIAAARASEHVGTVGARLDLTLTVDRVASFDREPFHSYGHSYPVTVYVTTLHDEAGHVFVVKTPRWSGTPGATVRLRATVAAHDYYRSIRQTRLERVTERTDKGHSDPVFPA